MRDKTVAGMLAIFLGAFGIHRFYLGQIFLGILYIFVLPFSALIGLIDGIRFLTMHQDVFDAKYNRDYQVQKRQYHRDKRTHRRNERRTRAKVKPRHQVKRTGPTNRERTARANRKLEFKKLYAEGKKYFKDYQFDEAESTYLKALSLAPDHPQLLFDLACLYAMKEDTDKGFEYLELAVHKGFNDFDQIDNDPNLAYLRIQDEFLDFAKAGYKRTKSQKEPLDTELLEQLRQLDILRSRGLLTELEFEKERNKLIH
ncbi:MAG TPA: NINE protein [Saprospiraceae bacterium]|nr:NINE protein [Saprospiraceae bacterium]